MKILVSTDTSCVVNYEVLTKNGISVFPLNVIIDGEEFLDGVTINQDQLLESMRGNKKVQTSTPPLGQVVDYFEKLFAEGYDHIIHFTISSKLSSMNQLFNNVASEYFPNKLTIIDGYSVCSLMLSHVLYALDEVSKGTTIEDIVKGIELRKENNYIIFIPENLTALKNGGRIDPTIAAIGNFLALKPVITLKDGKLVKDSVTRNIKKTFFDAIAAKVKKYPVSDYDYTIVSWDAGEKNILPIKEKLQLELPDYNIIEGLIPINVCAHCGPGTIGLLITPKINGKSINDYL